MVIRPHIMAAMRNLITTTLFAFVALLSVAAGGASAGAQGIERLGDFDDWSAFRFAESGNKACYMASQPVKAEGNYTKRGDIYALVTHRPAENRRDEVSFIAGYSFRENSTVQVAIGGQGFQLFTSEDGAWTANKDEDQKLVQAMIKGNRMVVKGTSLRGTATTDTYSLKGFTSAYQAITDTCGLQ
jgi:invasion protein IalB